MQADRQNSEVPYYADDEDANRKKYTRRGVLKSFSAILISYISIAYSYQCSEYIDVQVNSCALFSGQL